MTDQVGPGIPADNEERIAGLHLRTGSLLLARAELESLAAHAAITGPALADLAEARWRMGDLGRAAEAAAAHLASGGKKPVAILILAEAETVAGRADDARRHLAALEGLPATELVALLAGMPHRANRPALSERAPEPSPIGSPRRSATGTLRTAAHGQAARESASSVAATTETSPGDRIGKRPSRAAFPDSADLLSRARDDLRGREPERTSAAFDRLGLVLRLDPAIAAQVLDLVARRQEPAALLVRGDAMRILGHVLEAEAAYASAATALEKQARGPSS